jgi:osmotically-inducible protein OsmY
MRKEFGIVGGLGLGAGLIYLFDPRSGRRRRAVVRDQARHLWRASGKTVEKTSRDLGNRARGLVASLQSAGEDVSDDVLVDRVRSAIGHVISNVGNIEVTAKNGKITLVGSVLKKELPALLSRVSSVRNVREVVNRLSVQKAVAPKRSWLRPLLWTAGSAIALLGSSQQIRRIRA